MFEFCIQINQPDNTSCNDPYFCNGEEKCDEGICKSPGNPCEPQIEQCDENSKMCIPIDMPCLYDNDCPISSNPCKEFKCKA